MYCDGERTASDWHDLKKGLTDSYCRHDGHEKGENSHIDDMLLLYSFISFSTVYLRKPSVAVPGESDTTWKETAAVVRRF